VYCKSASELHIEEDAAVGVGADGRIEHFFRGTVRKSNSDSSNYDSATVTARREKTIEDLQSAGYEEILTAPAGRCCFWFPGFVDTHIHASQFANAGIFGKTTLLSWLERYTFPMEASLAEPERARAVYSRCVARTLACGTTTAAYYATSDAGSTNLLADVCLAAGQRAFVGRCGMDSALQPDYYKDVSVAASVAATEATIAHVRAIDPVSEYITPVITPRFAPSCTSELLHAFGELHRSTGLPVQTHISENKKEVALVKQLFPNSSSYADVYDAAGLLTPKTILAHGCHFTPEEVALIRDRGTCVSHCPVSNTFIGSGICPVRELLDAGIRVGLGTDVSGGWSASVLTAAREAGGMSRLRTAVEVAKDDAGNDNGDHRKLSVEELLFLATRGGAACLGMENRTGAFEQGMQWDAQFVDLGPVLDAQGRGGRGNVEVWAWNGWEERLAKWLFTGDDRNTRAVWVGGRLVSGGMDDI
jgi:guanine deaminase